MKKTILLFLFFTCGNLLFAQESLTLTEKLATTAKIWGFLKYYHPEVADGKYNWDEQLFDVLPKVKSAGTKEELSSVYLDWINELGKISRCKRCGNKKGVNYFDKNFDLNWLGDENRFTSELTEKLKFIETNRHQGKKYYVTSGRKNVGNIEVVNEIEYTNFDWQNENLRLLTLFRYWNIVEYFFPYKYQTDTQWEDVLNKMIPKFIAPESEEAFHLAMLELITSIDDSHGGFITEKTKDFFGHYWVPVSIVLIDGNAVVTGFYDEKLAGKDDLRIGDVITKVNGEIVETIFMENAKYIYGSNMARKKAKAHFAVFNGASDSVEIEFIRNNNTYTKSVKRYLYKEFKSREKNKPKIYDVLENNIGYVDMGQLKVADVGRVMKSLVNTKALILDIRSYPKGTLYKIANYISSRENEFFKAIYPDLDYPGKFIWSNGVQCGQNGALKYKGKVVLLVNEGTQSHAEFTAMCLQTGDHVTTIGRQTSGADGNVSRIRMVGGYKTMISGIGIFYPDHSETQRKGVKIDIEVRPTVKGIIEGRDEVLEKAIEFINK